MSVLIKHMAMPKGCIYANDKDQTEYCPLLNHDDVPFCQYIETEPEIAIGIDERPVYCPLFDVSESCQDTVSRAAAVDALDEIESEIANGYGYRYPKWRKYFCELPSAQPDTDEWCHDCKEYDKEHHCCPRWNRVIRTTLEEAQPDKTYEQGWKDGREALRKEIWENERDRRRLI